MKLEYLSIVGFQGIESLDIDAPNPVVVVSGPNASGKSSVRDAIQFAMTGESGRCKLKKNYGNLLINDNTKKKDGLITMSIDGVDYQRKVATGAHTGDDEPDTPIIMPFLIGTTKLALCDDKQVQRVCVAATGIKMSHADIKAKLLDKGAETSHVTKIMPFLRGGFAAGMKEARSQATQARGEWKGITNETYGKEKAKDWAPESIDVEAIENEIMTEIGKLTKQRDELIMKREKYAPGEAMIGGSCLPKTNFVDIGPCPKCGVELRKRAGNGWDLYAKGEEPAEDHVPEPKTQDRNVETYESVDRLVSAAEQAIGREKAKRNQAARDFELQSEVAHRALLAHTEVENWINMADLLSPTGLPGELLKEALKPINDRLHETENTTGWPVTINSLLEVEFGGRPYSMCSESEQWRCDVAMSEALSYVSGVKMFAADRMDILAPADRGVFIKWISAIKEEHDTILVMATLKAEPKMPYGFTSVWLGE